MSKEHFDDVRSSPFSIISVTRIWDAAPHNAFTDLIRFRGRWYCTFREGKAHVRGTGKVRVIVSDDTVRWESAYLAAERGVDLRDPKLSVTPDGRLMLLMGGTRFKNGQYTGRQPRVMFSIDGVVWSKPEQILSDGDWLWRVSWHRGTAYGVSYRLKSARVWEIFLLASEDGRSYRELCKLPVRGKPNETTVRVGPDGEMVALVRREGGDRNGLIGTSSPPYVRWTFSSAGLRLGGPNFLYLPDGRMVASTRVIRRDERQKPVATTVLGLMTQENLTGFAELPSGGDCSYPGLVWFRRTLWISYYSTHEGKASIYLARAHITG
jgi:hypothetical protein